MKTYYLKTKDTESKTTLDDLKEIRKYIESKYKIDCRIVVREYL